MSDLEIRHRVTADHAGATAAVEVRYTDATASHALWALDEAYAKARALINRETPCNAAAPATAYPSALIDDDGDRWEHEGNGMYRFSHYDARSVESVRAFAGIAREIS